MSTRSHCSQDWIPSTPFHPFWFHVRSPQHHGLSCPLLQLHPTLTPELPGLHRHWPLTCQTASGFRVFNCLLPPLGSLSPWISVWPFPSHLLGFRLIAPHPEGPNLASFKIVLPHSAPFISPVSCSLWPLSLPKITLFIELFFNYFYFIF